MLLFFSATVIKRLARGLFDFVLSLREPCREGTHSLKVQNGNANASVGPKGFPAMPSGMRAQSPRIHL